MSTLDTCPDDFFDGNDFKPAVLARELRERWDIRVNYWGVSRKARAVAVNARTDIPDDSILPRAIATLLGDHWRKRYDTETLQYLVTVCCKNYA